MIHRLSACNSNCSWRILICFGILRLLIAMVAQAVNAAVTRWSMTELTLRAGLIVHGRVVKQTSTWNPEHTAIFTEHTVEVINSIRGRPEGRLAVVVPGGVVEDIGLSVSPAPLFALGEEVLVFLEPSPTNGYHVMGSVQGRYTIRQGWAVNDESGVALPLRSVISQVLEIMDRHDIASSLPRDWESIVPQASSSPPDTRHLLNFVYEGYHWPQPDPMGEDYLVNVNAADVPPSEALQAILAAADTWTAVSTADFEFTYGGSSTATDAGFNNKNEILWKDQGNTGNIALTWFWYRPTSKEILETDMVINDYYQWDTSGSPTSEEFDLQTAALHEFGHFLHLGHDDNPQAVMYYGIAPGEVHRTLHQNDIDGISFIYPVTATPSPTATPTPSPTTTPTFTPTPTPTPSPTPTPTPSPTPWRIIYDFIPHEEGWTTGGAPVVYALPDFAWETDYLKTISQTNTNTFGYWQSPPNAIPADADYLYRARFTVSTDITDRTLVPQLRVRANSSNLQQYDVLLIESAGDAGASPGLLGKDYDLYFVPPANDSAATLAFDLLNFNPSDAPVAELALDTVIVERFALDSLSAATLVQDYTFDVSTDGWTTGGAPIAFSTPQYRYAGGALELRALTNTNTFGYWVNDPADITIEADRLYRGIFVVRTDVTNPALVPEMRLRFNAGNFQASQSFGITSAGDGANSPGTMNTPYDRLYFLPPANCIGESLIVSFDMLNFNPADAAEASFILDRATIETIPLPALP
jgi:hypothetical protein